MPSLVVDVLVVGAGPAGAAAAVYLARAGLHTLVIDRAVFPRDKCCGDGLTTLALRELQRLGLQPNEVPSWHVVHAATMRSPSGREHVFPLPDGASYFAAVARRVHLDEALVNLARAAGATVAEGQALRAAAPSDDGDAIHAQVDKLGLVSADWAIGADGMWSPLRKALGLNPARYRGEWHAFRQYFRNLGPRANELTVWFEPDLLPGYAWSFPLGDGRANVGFGIQRGGHHAVGSMKRLWHDLLARPHVQDLLGPDAQARRPHRAWPIPARVGRLPLAAGRALFVGDAAGMSDPLTGEGIGQALLSGRLAAEAIIGNLHQDRGRCTAEIGSHEGTALLSAATDYTRRARSELVADDRMSRALTRILSQPWSASGALRLAGATAWSRRNFARWMFEDYPRALFTTPRRWHRGVLNRPGAFASPGQPSSCG